MGGFGGMVRVPEDVRDPILVTSTDSVGTKVLVAVGAKRHDTIGEDLVNHCVNDILVHAARPIAFLDYVAVASVDPDTVAAIVEGVARGCRMHDMALAGGEVAEMPDLYQPGHYDLAGTILGVVSEGDALHGDRVRPGDVLVGYASTGLHTNGYSLARRIVFDQLGLDMASEIPELGTSAADALLRVHRSYHASVSSVLPRESPPELSRFRFFRLAARSRVGAHHRGWVARQPRSFLTGRMWGEYRYVDLAGSTAVHLPAGGG